MGFLKSTILVAAILTTVCTVSMAADYGSMTTEELNALRGTMFNATEQERNAFRAEWQSRVREMTPEEHSQYMGKGNGPGKGKQKGGSKGKGYGKSQGGGRQQ